MPIRQITIVGTGLIGGSFGLALRKHGFAGTIVGCDRPLVLGKALMRAAIDCGEPDPARSCQSSDVIFFSTPVGSILALFEKLAPTLPASTLLTDAGSTKLQFVERARMVLGADAATRVLPGHPMAGKEYSGIEHADAELFHGAVWLVTPIGLHRAYTPLQDEYLALIASVGARVIEIDPERHDLLCAWISHLPQMISTAFASAVREELGDDDAIEQIGGRALREMTRIAHSPYSMWRDIAITNSKNLEAVILRFEQQLAYLRENLRDSGLRELFDSANLFGHKHPGPKPDSEDN